MLDRPKCLHIPLLHEGATDQLSWAVVDGSTAYRLERQFNETFEDASRGRTWSQFDSIEKTWDQADDLDLEWDQLEVLPAIGRTWDSLDIEALAWDEIEARSLTWQDFARLPHSFAIYKGPGLIANEGRGITWSQLEAGDVSWKEIESINLTWGQIENLIPFISWDKLEAHWLDWDNLEEKNLTWDDFERLLDYKDHLAADDTIKIGARTAIYRIKAFDTSGEGSEFLTSSILPVIPIFYREATLRWQTIRGARYLVLIEGRDLRDTERVPLTFRYGAGVLEMKNFRAQNLNPSVRLHINADTPGEVRFHCIISAQNGESWSGCVTLIEFIARRTGLAEVSLF